MPSDEFRVCAPRVGLQVDTNRVDAGLDHPKRDLACLRGGALVRHHDVGKDKSRQFGARASELIAHGADRLLWNKQLGIPWNAADAACGDLFPHIGITATPVIDKAANVAYFMRKTYHNGDPAQASEFWMHKVSLTDGSEQLGFPVLIQGSSQNTGVVFDAKYLNSRDQLAGV